VNTDAHEHHYVAQWYQRRFLQPGQTKYHYLDLHPETVVNGKVRYTRRDLLNWGPALCFCRDDLYTLKLGSWTTDQVERNFFGAIDTSGRKAVEFFGNYNGYAEGVHDAFPALPQYMDAQRFRTPRGLDQLKVLTEARDHNQTLMAMQRLFQLHTTMWTEGVWEIVRARQSSTKFIVSDEPVTFFNRRLFPGESVYPGKIELDQIGTRTLFPLGLDSCLIITHLQLVRNPKINPNELRVNARAYDQTLAYLLDIQFGRELEEDEVLRINFILKTRATRYIAAAERDWLYPERGASTTNWSKLDDDWFLLPHLYKVSFSAETMAGSKDGSSRAWDEYGRQRGHPKFGDKKRRDKEWATHLWARQEWARKRLGKSIAHIHSAGPDMDAAADRVMQAHLSGKGDIDD
jgi:hypothetical protein